MSEKMSFKYLKEKFLHSCKAGHLDTVKELYEQLALIKVNSHATQIFQHNLVTGLYEAIEFKHWDIAQYLVEQNSNELHENGYLDTEELLYNSCSRNQVNLTRCLLQKNKVTNLDLNPAFRAALSSESIDVLKLLIFEHNIEKNNGLNEWLKTHSKIGELVNRMFEARDLGISLNEQLGNTEKNNTIKKVKI